MQKNIILFVIFSCTSIQSFAMELAKQKDNRDFFSQMPNKTRKLILFPLIKHCTNYQEVKKTLLSVGLISKKSYEQINCIFFVTDIVKELSKKWKCPTGTVALHLGTPGSLHYKNLGDDLYHLAMSTKCRSEQLYQLHYLINKGADIDFQTTQFTTTPLIKATHKSNPYLVFYLIRNGANVNAQSNNKYVREHSILYDRQELEHYFILLAHLLKSEQTKNHSQHYTNHKLYTSPFGTIIRNALSIDNYLETIGGFVHEHNKYAVEKTLSIIYRRINSSRLIHHIITDEKNRKKQTYTKQPSSSF